MDDLDLHRQRRNLIAFSIGLLAFEAAGGKLESISLLDGGVKLDQPHALLALIYVGWVYTLWRYWLYSKDRWTNVRDAFFGFWHHSRAYKSMIGPHVKAFRDASGVEYAESWDQFVQDETPGQKPIPIPLEKAVRRGFASTTLVLEIGKAQNPKGDFHPDRMEYPLPFVRYELNRLGAMVRTVFADKAFSDVAVPYVLAIGVVVAKCFNVLNG